MEHITDEEYQLAYESAHEFARKKIQPLTSEIERTDEFPTELWKPLAEQGYLGVGIPAEYGGSGGDYHMAALVLRGVTRVNPAIAMSVGAHLNLCGHNILRNGTAEQKRTYLPRLVRAESIGGLAL